MNIFKALSVAAVASTLLFTATACGGGTTSGPEVAPTAQSEEAAASSKAEVVSVVTSFYEVVSDAEKLQPLIEASGTITEEKSNEESEEIVTTAAPEIFALFDLEEEDSTLNAYIFIQTMSQLTSLGEDLTFSAPESAVTIDGDTAKYDSNRTDIFVGGVEKENLSGEATDETDIKLVKKDGVWLIVPPAV